MDRLLHAKRSRRAESRCGRHDRAVRRTDSVPTPDLVPRTKYLWTLPGRCLLPRSGCHWRCALALGGVETGASSNTRSRSRQQQAGAADAGCRGARFAFIPQLMDETKHNANSRGSHSSALDSPTTKQSRQRTLARQHKVSGIAIRRSSVLVSYPRATPWGPGSAALRGTHLISSPTALHLECRLECVSRPQPRIMGHVGCHDGAVALQRHFYKQLAPRSHGSHIEVGGICSTVALISRGPCPCKSARLWCWYG